MGNVRKGFLYADKAAAGLVAPLMARADLGAGGLLSTQFAYAEKASGRVHLRADGQVADDSGHITRSRLYADKASSGPSAEVFGRGTPVRYASVWKILPGVGVVWAFDTGGTARGILVTGGYVYVCGYNSRVWKLNATTGHLVWCTGQLEADPRRAVLSGGYLYVAGHPWTSSGALAKIDDSDGSIVWQVDPDIDANDVCVDGAGKIHVCGENDDWEKATLFRYDAAGNFEDSILAIHGLYYGPPPFIPVDACGISHNSGSNLLYVATTLEAPYLGGGCANGITVNPATYAYPVNGYFGLGDSDCGGRLAIRAYDSDYVYRCGDAADYPYGPATVIVTKSQGSVARDFSTRRHPLDGGISRHLHVNATGWVAVGTSVEFDGTYSLHILETTTWGTEPRMTLRWRYELTTHVYGVHLEDGGLGTGHVYAAGLRCDDWTDYAGITL